MLVLGEQHAAEVRREQRRTDLRGGERYEVGMKMGRWVGGYTPVHRDVSAHLYVRYVMHGLGSIAWQRRALGLNAASCIVRVAGSPVAFILARTPLNQRCALYVAARPATTNGRRISR